MFQLKSFLDSEKRIKKWFKPIPGVEKCDARVGSDQRAIFGHFGLFGGDPPFPQNPIKMEKIEKFLYFGGGLPFFDPRSPKKSFKNILDTSRKP